MSGPVTGLEVRANALHASPSALETGARVEEEIPPPSRTEGFLPCARWWVHAGYTVFPLYPANEPVRDGDTVEPGKKPNARLLGDGNTADTIGSTNPRQIERWWRDEPTSGVAIAVRASGVLIVDIDPKNRGWEHFLPYCEAHGIDLSEVPRSSSPRGDGGVHLYWRVPKGAGYTFGKFLTGVDRPWQVPVPPSPRWVRVAEDRKGSAVYGWSNYTWLVGDPRKLPEAPAVLLGEVPQPVRPAGDDGEGWESSGGWDGDDVLPTTDYGTIDHDRLTAHPIPIGDQNKAFKRIACSMVRYRALDPEITQRLLELAEISPVGDPNNPWTRVDMERIVKAARRYVETERKKELAAAETVKNEGLSRLERLRKIQGLA